MKSPYSWHSNPWEELVSEDNATRRSRREATAAGGIPRRSPLKVAAILLGTLVVLVVGGVLAVQFLLNSQIERIDDPFADLTDRPTRPAPSAGATEEPGEPPVNVLVLGSDSRISAGDPSQWEYGAQRTDAIMIVQVSGDRQDAFVMSIPRDSWVPIPGYGMAKINAAFSYGGPTLMIQTVEQLTGIYIDHFAVTDFESFATITDALGGVRLTLPNGLDNNGVVLAPGEHVLTGEQALAYVRQRYGLSGGDFSRVQRQQNWMRGIMREVFEQEILKDIPRLTSFSSTVLQSVAVDEGMTLPRMVSVGYSLKDLRGDDVTFMTAPYAGTGWSPDGRQSIVVLDEARSQALFDAFATDSVREFLDANPDGAVMLPANPE